MYPGRRGVGEEVRRGGEEGGGGGVREEFGGEGGGDGGGGGGRRGGGGDRSGCRVVGTDRAGLLLRVSRYGEGLRVVSRLRCDAGAKG